MVKCVCGLISLVEAQTAKIIDEVSCLFRDSFRVFETVEIADLLRDIMLGHATLVEWVSAHDELIHHHTCSPHICFLGISVYVVNLFGWFVEKSSAPTEVFNGLH